MPIVLWISGWYTHLNSWRCKSNRSRDPTSDPSQSTVPNFHPCSQYRVRLSPSLIILFSPFPPESNLLSSFDISHSHSLFSFNFLILQPHQIAGDRLPSLLKVIAAGRERRGRLSGTAGSEEPVTKATARSSFLFTLVSTHPTNTSRLPVSYISTQQFISKAVHRLQSSGSKIRPSILSCGRLSSSLIHSFSLVRKA